MERKSYLQFRMKEERALYLRVTLCADCAPSLQLLPPLHPLLLPCPPFRLPPLSFHLGVRESFQTLPSPLKAGLEALCGGGRRERNMSGEGWWETVNHGHDAEGPGHPRGVLDEGKSTQACEMPRSCSLSLGTHREAVCAYSGWDMGRGRLGCPWVIPGIGASLSAQRSKKGVRNMQSDDHWHDERRDVGRHIAVSVPRMNSQTWNLYCMVTFMAEILGFGGQLQHIALMELAVSGAEGKLRQHQRLAPAPEEPFCSQPQSGQTISCENVEEWYWFICHMARIQPSQTPGWLQAAALQNTQISPSLQFLRANPRQAHSPS